MTDAEIKMVIESLSYLSRIADALERLAPVVVPESDIPFGDDPDGCKAPLDGDCLSDTSGEG